MRHEVVVLENANRLHFKPAICMVEAGYPACSVTHELNRMSGFLVPAEFAESFLSPAHTGCPRAQPRLCGPDPCDRWGHDREWGRTAVPHAGLHLVRDINRWQGAQDSGAGAVLADHSCCSHLYSRLASVLRCLRSLCSLSHPAVPRTVTADDGPE